MEYSYDEVAALIANDYDAPLEDVYLHPEWFDWGAYGVPQAVPNDLPGFFPEVF